ncbi:MAG TPA: thiamine pyrophosphate-binding protein [Thermoanaerobaculia bacterium]
MNGGERVAAALLRHGVRFVFTLCGGHISPILVGAKRAGMRVVDVRHEADAVFAADAVARLTGVPGVAAVTAGPGATNAVTAVKNAQLAQSPLVLLGGAAATLLKGRGSLQDIDQRALMAPHVKEAITVVAVRDLEPAVDRAFALAREGVPGPVFVECPVDLLYDEALVRQWYGAAARGGGLAGAGKRWYLRRHANRLFRGAGDGGARRAEAGGNLPVGTPGAAQIAKLAARLARARRPVLVLGSQAMLAPGRVAELAAAVAALGAPVYLAGGARGLLGVAHPLQLRHRRREALKGADLVLLAGIPSDFRLDYGRQVGRRAELLSVNRSPSDLALNRKPDVGLVADPSAALIALAGIAGGLGRGKPASRWAEWLAELKGRDAEREREIDEQAKQPTDHVNPLFLCREIDRALGPESVLVADGGDFVATASYTVSPRAPLSWLDPGVFGTLGVGGGFALGAKLCRPQADVWLLWGDGASALSLAEFDSFARHGLPVIAVVGNDAGWTQIAREQVEVLGDDVATVLARTDYHRVAEGYGGRGLLVSRPEEVRPALEEALALARAGQPVLVNALLGRTDFRKGSISM